MRFPFVPRFVYDDLLARFDALTDRHHALKLAGAMPPRAELPAVRPPALDPAERLQQSAAEAYERDVLAEMVAAGKSELEARTIAKQLRAAVMDLSPVSFDG